MISWEKAKKLLSKQKVNPKKESIPLSQALDRILAEELIAPLPHPAFSRSTMDGYVFHLEEEALEVQLIDEIHAGDAMLAPLKRGKCYLITTGSPLPKGGGKVVPLEKVSRLRKGPSDWIKLNETWKTLNQTSYVTERGKDYQKGTRLLKPGVRLGPSQLAVLAACGKARVTVYVKLKIGVLSTGNELVEPGLSLQEGQIWDSNRIQLLSQLKNLGFEGLDLGLVKDDFKALSSVLKKNIKKVDGLLVTGGMSVGDRDFSIPAFKALGAEVHFDRVAVKPGKPTVYATVKNEKKNKFVFGLPGNPVSAYAIFEMLVKNYLRQAQGESVNKVQWVGQLNGDLVKLKGSRVFMNPMKLNELGKVEPIKYHGSSHLHAYTEANVLYIQMPGVTPPKIKDWIPLEWLNQK